MGKQEKLASLSAYAQKIKDRLAEPIDNICLKEFLERDLKKTLKRINDLKLEDGRGGKL